MHADKYMAGLFVLNYVLFGFAVVNNCGKAFDEYLKQGALDCKIIARISFNLAMLVANYYFACLMMSKLH